MGKAVRIDDNDRLARALAEGAEYLVVGRRRFREEIRALAEALQDDSPLLEADEGRKYLKERLREHGIG